MFGITQIAHIKGAKPSWSEILGLLGPEALQFQPHGMQILGTEALWGKRKQM